ncbi:hypothetical protein CGRA01v4_10273 [Colletotrichum graminicola]|uniref:Uncharacterized protein n=1 Tax=Colletotrichum graminicola (strain M1.001 / M2 / FGSC 10212) TaxID=645133 RepID=E3QD59_COLGM|nr:uncharacterized protein GLRG_03975 [Colletotrichum graminicola M1.001]EFQ28831.1 hypothetical protein GLRG_03975 [Colletotrichum graminicola M1.001]WDK18986.1 hypothetical protein CGRA01v4_10273 [Colletotrichum graminicola]
MSSISRAFTTRRVKNSIDLSDAARGKERTNILQRSKTTKAQYAIRHKISAPMELVHTTNMLSYNAPDIRPRTGTDASSNSSRKSTEEDSESARSAASSPPTSPDVAPHELLKEPNHLSCYFVSPGAPNNASKTPEVPTIPKRAPTHTKQASFDAVARQRSLSQMSKASDKTVSSKASMTFSARASSGSSAASTMSHHSITPAIKTPLPPMPTPAFQHQSPRQEKVTESHPFGRELAQVTEIAEEFGIKDDVMYEEERLLKAEGLYKFAADDYLSEVQSLFPNFFTDSQAPQRSMATAWI